MPSLPSENQTIHPLPHLPPELWLHILTFLPLPTLFLILRQVHPLLKSEIETHTLASQLPAFTLSHTFSLTSGQRHRWYDVRATVTLVWAGRLSEDGNVGDGGGKWALLELRGFTPQNYTDRACAKWKAFCGGGGVGAGLEWQAEFEGQMGVVRLGDVIAEEGEHGEVMVWVDWREVVGRWMRGMEARTAATYAE